MPPAERGKHQGLIGSVIALATITGPRFGGLVTEALSWRWVFYVNLPLGALALVVTSFVLRPPAALVLRELPLRRGLQRVEPAVKARSPPLPGAGGPG